MHSPMALPAVLSSSDFDATDGPKGSISSPRSLQRTCLSARKGLPRRSELPLPQNKHARAHRVWDDATDYAVRLL
jgi:hypothetical protein